MKTITKNDLQPAERPGDGWYIIECPGRYENDTTDGTRVVQELSAETLAAIAEAGVPAEGLPIDKDHLSLDHANSTEAMGWVRELAMCGDALAARIEWTALGLPLIQGKVYKHFSTVYPLPDLSHARCKEPVVLIPERLTGLALTNQPNNAGAPAITNRAAAASSSGVASRAQGDVQSTMYNVQSGNKGAPEGAQVENRASGSPYPSAGTNEEETRTQNSKTEMNPEILKALGLAEDATDQEVLDKIQTLTQTAEDAQAAAQEAAEAEADQVIETEQSVANTELEPEEKKECKEQILANRDHGIKYTRLLCNSKRATTTTTTRKYQGKAPAVTTGRTQSREERVANRAQELCDEGRKAGRKVNYWTAKAQAEREIGKESK